MQASMVRSRARWVEMGEKPTRYFCNLEKRNYTNKALSVVQLEDKTITDQPEILKEQANFFRQLYKSSYSGQTTNLFLNEDNVHSLTVDKKQECEGPITEQEIKFVLKNMDNNKSPGNDGYPAEFFKFFWQDLGHFIVRSFKHALSSGSLSITQKRGIITCIPKGDKPRQFLKKLEADYTSVR